MDRSSDAPFWETYRRRAEQKTALNCEVTKLHQARSLVVSYPELVHAMFDMWGAFHNEITAEHVKDACIVLSEEMGCTVELDPVSWQLAPQPLRTLVGLKLTSLAQVESRAAETRKRESDVDLKQTTNADDLRTAAAEGEAETLVPAVPDPEQTDQLDELPTSALEAESHVTPSAGVSREDHRIFRKSGDGWELGFNGKSTLINQRKGMEYIAHLLRSPDHEVQAVQLFKGIAGQPDAFLLGSAGNVLDSVALKAYRSRRKDLKDRLDEAERNNDPGRKETVEAELDMLEEEVTRATGLGGRSRQAHSDAEKTRKSVRIAIQRAIESIEKQLPELAQYLDIRIERGNHLRYRGDQKDWQF